MTDEERIKAELTSVRSRRQQLAAQFSDLEKRHANVRQGKSWHSLKLAYFGAARKSRKLSQALIGWRFGMVIVYFGLFVVIALFCRVVLGSGYGSFASVVGAAGAVAVVALHYMPGDAGMANQSQASELALHRFASEDALLRAQLKPLKREIDELTAEEARLEENVRRANRQWQLQQARLALLNLPWKTYRSIEFEQFLKSVFEALDGSVEMTKTTGDQGADLIVRIGGRRLAVQVKGYMSSVGNAAVQQAYSGMKFYACDGCMVVTNSLFTASAVALADATGCILIDEIRLPDLILGKTNVCQFAGMTLATRAE